MPVVIESQRVKSFPKFFVAALLLLILKRKEELQSSIVLILFVSFVVPDFQAFLREYATQEMLKKLEDHMEHLTEEQNMGTSSNSVN